MCRGRPSGRCAANDAWSRWREPYVLKVTPDTLSDKTVRTISVQYAAVFGYIV